MLDFSKRLVLNQYLIKVFGGDFDYIKSEMKRPNYGGADFNSTDEEDISIYARFLMQDTRLSGRLISVEKIKEYDENIVRYTRSISKTKTIKWLYFQYLCLIFTEYYLDMFFGHREQLKAELNRIVSAHNVEARDDIPPYEDGELNKIAFMCATGSGKTLIMQMNYLQIKHYIELYDLRNRYNQYLLIMPNEKLSSQHISEYASTGIGIATFDKHTTMRGKDSIAVLEITKLLTEEKYRSLREDGVSVSTESLYTNNILFVDEGHRGVSSEENTWFTNRSAISKDGFTFEYSATFKQAVASNSTLAPIYAKCIIFDYSYKYFYMDGYGKEYAIHNVNLSGNENNRAFQTYLTGCLLSFYQQKKYFLANGNEMSRFHIETPLMVLLGNNVVALKQNRQGDVLEDGTVAEKATLSDVAVFIRFLRDFTTDKDTYVKEIESILQNTTELVIEGNEQLFNKAFPYLKQKGYSAAELYNDILRCVFNTSGGSLKIANIKNAAGQIRIQVGDETPFGLIYVGEDTKLVKYLQEAGIDVDDSYFGKDLFDTISDKESPVNILIGAKKFIEGWNCYRISSMGFLNVGVSEGSQIIQMFGRGVRLHGYDNCLKRSTALIPPERTDEFFSLIETLTIFGIRANYINAFSEMLKKEDINPPVVIEMPIFYNKPAPQKYKILRVVGNAKYERTGIRFELAYDESVHVTLNCYLSAQTIVSVDDGTQNADLDTLSINQIKGFIEYVDWDALYFDTISYCNRKGYANLMVTKADIKALVLRSSDWATVYAPESYSRINAVGDVYKLQNVLRVLLHKYIDVTYKQHKGKWEADKLEYVYIEDDDQSKYLSDERYSFTIDSDKTEFIQKISEIVDIISKERAALKSRAADRNIRLWSISAQREKPLVYAKGDLGITVSPISLVESEDAFLNDLQSYLDGAPAELSGKELYIIRNKSKTGIGFFESRYFFPDFILWVIDGGTQYISFIDPKGIGRVGVKDEKIQLSHGIKEKQAQLGDPSIVLNSFILSYTPYRELPKYGVSKDEWEANGVLFMKDDRASYVNRMFKNILS